MRIITDVVLTAFAVALGASAASSATVRVNVTGLKSTNGEVRCAMFKSPKGFPRDLTKADLRTRATIRAHVATCVFENVPPGTAAVSVIHDANDNKKLDFKFGFIPSEGVGWSNNPKVRFSPPTFDAARFQVGTAPTEITVRLLHR